MKFVTAFTQKSLGFKSLLIEGLLACSLLSVFWGSLVCAETGAIIDTDTKVDSEESYRQVKALSLGSILGFGVGHAFQDRYAEKGWVFTVVEGGLLLTPIKGAVLLVFLGVKAYEIFDLTANFQEYKKSLNP